MAGAPGYTGGMPDNLPRRDLVTIDDLKELIEENIELTKDTRKMLKDMRREAFIGGLIKMLIWIILIVASFYFSMKFLEPYLGMLGGAGSDKTDWAALIDQYKGYIAQ